jgi:hypothetical protein
MIRKTLKFFCVIALFTSCDNELNITADWKDIPVVYGILNGEDPINYVKLNKVFLGQGDVISMAQQFDSLHYNPDHVGLRLIESQLAGNQFTPIKTIEMEVVDDIIKPYGLFSSPSQIIYQTDQVLNHLRHYTVEVYNKDSEEVIASNPIPIDLLKPLSMSSPNGFTPVNMVPDGYISKAEWVSIEGAKLYELNVRFYYAEQQISDLSDVSYKSLNWSFPYRMSSSMSGGENMSVNIDALQFLTFLSSSIEDNPNVYRQVQGVQGTSGPSGFAITHSCLDFSLIAAGNDLSTYINLNENSNSIVVDRPEYTNILNSNGQEYVGIFSSRSNVFIDNIRLNNISNDEIAFNEITKHLNFAYFRAQTNDEDLLVIDTLYVD